MRSEGRNALSQLQRQTFLKLQRECLIVRQASVIHGQNLTNPANRLFGWTGQSHDQFIGRKFFQLTNGVNPQKRKRLLSVKVVLKDHGQWSVRGNSRSPCP